MHSQSNEQMTLNEVYNILESAGAIVLVDIWTNLAAEAKRYYTLPSTLSRSTAKHISTYANVVETLFDIRNSNETDGY